MLAVKRTLSVPFIIFVLLKRVARNEQKQETKKCDLNLWTKFIRSRDETEIGVHGDVSIQEE